jgi:hypothetical protein
MAEYISASDLQSRLTPQGIVWVADRDGSGTGVSSEEETLYVLPAIQYAGAVVDQHIQSRTNIDTARASGNQWLQDRCLDLAEAVALQTGGREIPAATLRREEMSLDWLRQHAAGQIDIPGYTYDTPAGSGGIRDRRGPRVYNPRRPLR